MLVVENVSKRYGKVLANDNLSFNVKAGEVAVLAGPNGAGKSTIIKCIAGLLRYDGSIKINHMDNKSVEAKRVIAYIPETPTLFSLLTVWEHLEYISRAYSLKDWEDSANVMLKAFHLDDKKKELSVELSKGMQQKLSIICALLIQPDLVLFDEPLIGLDPHAIKELKNLIKNLREEGKAILISTHILDSVEDLWDQCIIMVKGTIETQLTKKEIKDGNESLSDLFFNITEMEGDSL